MMQKFFAKIFGQSGPAKGAGAITLAHEVVLHDADPLYVIGDLHGCTPLLQQAEAAILDDLAGGKGHLLLLGDVIDRGPQSAEILDHLLRPAPKGVTRHMILGNHEMMFLRFAASPARHASWLDFGGRETLLSYGIEVAGFEDLNAKRQAQMLAAHIPQAHLDFLSRRPATIVWGSYLFVHAGIDPAKPLGEQTEEDLMWNRRPPEPQALPQGVTLVHGHIPVKEPNLESRVINLDVGAYMTGKLCTLRLCQDQEPRLIWV